MDKKTKELMQMADVFKMPKKNKFKYILFPMIMNNIRSIFKK